MPDPIPGALYSDGAHSYRVLGLAAHRVSHQIQVIAVGLDNGHEHRLTVDSLSHFATAFSPAGPQSHEDAPENPAEVVGQPVARISGTKLASPHYHYERMAQGVADQYGEAALLILSARSEIEGHERGIEVVLASQASSAELKAAGERKFHPRNANGKGGGQ